MRTAHHGVLNSGLALLSVVLLTSAPVLGVTIDYLNGKPSSVTGLTVAGTEYTALIVYDIDAAADPHRVGDLPDAQIDQAAQDLAAALNARDPDNAFPCNIRFQPNQDPQGLPGDQFAASAAVDDTAMFDDAWVANPTDSQFAGTAQKSIYVGFIQFSSVVGTPMVSTSGMLVLVLALAGVACWRVKRSMAVGHA